MDYKKILKSRALRLGILRMLSFIPDKAMIKLQYKIKCGRKLNLKNPQRYTEKLQWYKLYHRDPIMIQCVDKYDVREYIKGKGMESLLTTCYGVYDSVEDIDFEKLPSQFVMKDTLGGGGNSVIVVQDKTKLNIVEAKKQMQSWVKENTRVRSGGREWPYYNGKKHRIIIEEYLCQPDGDLADFKFYCFDGKVACFYIRSGYSGNHNDGKMTFFAREKECLKDVGLDYCRQTDIQPTLPAEIDEMIKLAEQIATGFPHVRADFYNVLGKVYFGEMTFFSASGYFMFTPDEFDYELGKKFVLPEVKK